MTLPLREPEVGVGLERLVVVVPARNERQRLTTCLTSLSQQDVPVRVYFSDNASDDGTADAAREFFDRVDLTVRTTIPLGPAEHFVSAGRWALEAEPEGEFFALLAGDDSWSDGFASASLATLAKHADVGAVFPSFVWEGDGEPRQLAPVRFRQRHPKARQRRALRLSDHRELSNLVYGVYRREAFTHLLTALQLGGDRFAVDYAAAWHVLGRHEVEICARAVGCRHIRNGADLIERAGFRRADVNGPWGTAWLYVRLNLRINFLIAAALRRVALDGTRPPASWVVQVIRAPQWLSGAVRQVRRL
jgi:glycosyltransferase involved in cell wall biosynthesis